jgi:hypothetical protein
MAGTSSYAMAAGNGYAAAPAGTETAVPRAAFAVSAPSRDLAGEAIKPAPGEQRDVFRSSVPRQDIA